MREVDFLRLLLDFLRRPVFLRLLDFLRDVDFFRPPDFLRLLDFLRDVDFLRVLCFLRLPPDFLRLLDVLRGLFFAGILPPAPRRRFIWFYQLGAEVQTLAFLLGKPTAAQIRLGKPER